MFGESDSESPRSPSPWDSFNPTPETPGIPKLVPEVEQGNVEYKLQLLSPTPFRFARLVTQLNWRLLEGGGQAYYELGVADSGALVGLPRQQLEESLETLEMMAGEIGASVIVVKEVKVPPELSSIAESQLERWEGKRSSRRKDAKVRLTVQDTSCPTSPAIPTTTTFPFDFELALYPKDEGEDADIVPNDRDLLKKQYASLTASVIDSEAHDVTDTEDSYLRSTCPKSLTAVSTVPISFPLNMGLALFTKDTGEDADIEPPDGHIDRVTDFPTNLEIVSVYKPLPVKKRALHSVSFPNSANSKHTKKKHKNGYPPSRSLDTVYSGDSTRQGPSASSNLSVPGESRTQSQSSRQDPLTGSLAGASYIVDSPKSLTLNHSHFTADLSLHDASEVTAVTPKESRHVAEVLVVKKMLSDDIFLDFEGFSLQ